MIFINSGFSQNFIKFNDPKIKNYLKFKSHTNFIFITNSLTVIPSHTHTTAYVIAKIIIIKFQLWTVIIKVILIHVFLYTSSTYLFVVHLLTTYTNRLTRKITEISLLLFFNFLTFILAALNFQTSFPYQNVPL